MGTLDNGDGTGHEVMITGYNKDGTCEYFDPQLGIYKTDIPGHFYNVIAITGKKNNN